jgi:hypothetical protein
MAFASGCIAIPLAGAVAHTGGDICSVANPEGVPLIITDVKLYAVTPSAGVCVLHVGIGAAATTHESNNLVNDLDIVATTAGTAWHAMTALVANGAAVVWGVTQFLLACGSADSTGFAGTLFVDYIRVA